VSARNAKESARRNGGSSGSNSEKTVAHASGSLGVRQIEIPLFAMDGPMLAGYRLDPDSGKLKNISNVLIPKKDNATFVGTDRTGAGFCRAPTTEPKSWSTRSARMERASDGEPGRLSCVRLLRMKRNHSANGGFAGTHPRSVHQPGHPICLFRRSQRHPTPLDRADLLTSG
jgi:hypothetical protein